MQIKSILLLSVATLWLSACGGGGDDPEPVTPTPTPTTTPSIGIFVDAPVAGLRYRTATQSGVTNSTGEYNYLPGETVSFAIGDIQLGSTRAGPVATPLSLVSGATDATDPVVTNIVRLLMTLDADGDPGNGIVIPTAADTAALGRTVDFGVADLANDAGATGLLAALPTTPTLVGAGAAQAHFSATLAAQSEWGVLAWGSGMWKSASP